MIYKGKKCHRKCPVGHYVSADHCMSKSLGGKTIVVLFWNMSTKFAMGGLPVAKIVEGLGRKKVSSKFLCG